MPKTDPKDHDPIETEITGSKTSTAPAAVDKSIKKPLMDTIKAVTAATKPVAGKKTTTAATKIPKRDNSRDKKSSTSSDDSKPSSGTNLIKIFYICDLHHSSSISNFVTSGFTIFFNVLNLALKIFHCK